MESCDTRLPETVFLTLWNRFCKRPFESHQFGPFDTNSVFTNTVAFHAARPIDNIGRSDKNLLGIAASKSACTTKRPLVDNCHRPSRGTAPRRNSRCCRAAANANKIETLGHTLRLNRPYFGTRGCRASVQDSGIDAAL